MRGNHAPNMTVHDLARRLAEPRPPLLVDVREADEWNRCRIEGAVHIPMSQFGERWGELDPSREIVVYCHHGMRSQRVADFMLERGFRRVWSLTGGIDHWSLFVDLKVPRY